MGHVSLSARSIAVLWLLGRHTATAALGPWSGYLKGARVPVLVNYMTEATRGQIPRDPYRMPFCQPEGGPSVVKSSSKQRGPHLQSSPYQVNMVTDVSCQKVCHVTLDRLSASKLQSHIKYKYHRNWVVGNHHAEPFPIGYLSTENGQVTYYLYNHVNIHVTYHQTSDKTYRVVDLAVEPLSVHHRFQQEDYQWIDNSTDGLIKPLRTCSATKHLTKSDIAQNQTVQEGESVIYTYDVIWHESPILPFHDPHSMPVVVALVLAMLVILVCRRMLRTHIQLLCGPSHWRSYCCYQ